MKNINTTQFILGLVVFIVGIILTFGSTYMYEYFKGNDGRELITVLLGVIIFIGSLVGSIILIVFSINQNED